MARFLLIISILIEYLSGYPVVKSSISKFSFFSLSKTWKLPGTVKNAIVLSCIRAMISSI